MITCAFLHPDKTLRLDQQRYALDAEGFDIGRQGDCDLVLLEESVSRVHARVEFRGDGWAVRDVGSSNGTFVNGRQVVDWVGLSNGDVLTLGKARLIFQCGADVDGGDGLEGAERGNGVRMVEDDESSSVILSTKASNRTPFTTGAVGESADEHLARLNQRLLALYQLSDILRGARDRETIVRALLDLVFESLPADRGVVFRLEGEAEEVVPELYHFRDGVGDHEVVVSRTILRRSLRDHVAVLSRDVQSDARFEGSESILGSDVRSAMCVPLAGTGKLMGLLVLDTREALHAFTEDDLAFVSALATDVAMTLENLELMEENLRQARLAAVGQTISGLAHNIKNILQLARGGTELMDLAIAKKSFEEIETLWPITKRSLMRMQALVEEMLAFSRPATVRLELTDLNEVVEMMAEMVEGEAAKKRVEMVVERSEEPMMAKVDRDALMKALMNLMSNGFDALEGREGGRISLVALRVHGHPAIRVEDNGPGIPKENQGRVFQPFFSTKASKGNGLGLAMTRKYLEDMGARVELASEEGRGTRFDLVFSG